MLAMSEYNVHRAQFIKYQPKSISSLSVEDDVEVHPRLAVARQNGSIEIWCPSLQWSLERVIPARFNEAAEILVWCGGKLFSAGLQGEIVKWDLDLLKEQTRTDSYGGPVWCMCTNMAKTTLAVGCEDGCVRLFDISTDGIDFIRALDAQKHRITSLTWSHDDSTLISGAANGAIRLYDTRTFQCTDRITAEKGKSKEVIVWCMKMLKDSTLVTGDSEGRTQFWDTVSCTLLQSFSSHSADVLTLCVNEDEATVFSSGVDSKVVKFSCVPAEEGSCQWTEVCHGRPTNHDTKALVIYAGDPSILIAGGLDSRLVYYDISKQLSTEAFVRMPFIPPTKMCHLAPNGMRLLYHDDFELHLWQFPAGSHSNSQPPKKLACIKAKPSTSFISCAISSCGNFIAYCDGTGLNLMQVEGQTDMMDIRLKKIRCLPEESTLIQRMKFTSNSKQLVTAASDGQIYVFDLKDTSDIMSKGILKKEHLFSGKKRQPWSLMTICGNDRLVCVTDALGFGKVFILKSGHLLFSLPNRPARPVALVFQPKSDILAVAYSDKHICLYNTLEKKVTSWSKFMTEENRFPSLLGVKDKFTNIVFNPFDPKEMFLQSTSSVFKMFLSKKLATCKSNEGDNDTCEVEKKKQRLDKYSKRITTCKRYSGVLLLDFNSDGSLVVVERPVQDIVASLAPALKMKRYGKK